MHNEPISEEKFHLLEYLLQKNNLEQIEQHFFLFVKKIFLQL